MTAHPQTPSRFSYQVPSPPPVLPLHRVHLYHCSSYHLPSAHAPASGASGFLLKPVPLGLCPCHALLQRLRPEHSTCLSERLCASAHPHIPRCVVYPPCIHSCSAASPLIAQYSTLATSRLMPVPLSYAFTFCTDSAPVRWVCLRRQGVLTECDPFNGERFSIRTSAASKLFSFQNRTSETRPLSTKGSPLCSLFAKIRASDGVSLQLPSCFPHQLPASPPITPPMSLPMLPLPSLYPSRQYRLLPSHGHSPRILARHQPIFHHTTTSLSQPPRSSVPASLQHQPYHRRSSAQAAPASSSATAPAQRSSPPRPDVPRARSPPLQPGLRHQRRLLRVRTAAGRHATLRRDHSRFGPRRSAPIARPTAFPPPITTRAVRTESVALEDMLYCCGRERILYTKHIAMANTETVFRHGSGRACPFLKSRQFLSPPAMIRPRPHFHNYQHRCHLRETTARCSSTSPFPSYAHVGAPTLQLIPAFPSRGYAAPRRSMNILRSSSMRGSDPIRHSSCVMSQVHEAVRESPSVPQYLGHRWPVWYRWRGPATPRDDYMPWAMPFPRGVPTWPSAKRGRGRKRASIP